MKFSDYFHAPGVRFLAFLFGIFMGLPAFFFMGWKIGVLVCASVTVVASVILPIRLYRADLPYNRVKSTIAESFLFDQRVRFTIRNGTVGGRFLLTQKSMIFLSFEQGEHRLELSRDDVKSVEMGENMTISIFLNDKQFVRVISGDCEAIYDILRDNQWAVR